MAEKRMVRLEPDPQVLRYLDRASEIVAQMPPWQRGILEASSRSTNSVPRPTPPPEPPAKTQDGS